MARMTDLETLIRDALPADLAARYDELAEPGLWTMAAAVLRGRLWWVATLFSAMMMVFLVLGVFCGVRFLGAEQVPNMLRWGAGMVLCVIAVIGGKIWYWMEMHRVALTSEVRRVELLQVAILTELGADRG